MIGEETRKISYEVIKAHQDFIMEYAIKPNVVFIGLKQQQAIEKENRESNMDHYIPFYPFLSGNGAKPKITCLGMPISIIDEYDHISVGLMGAKVYETN